MRYVKGDGIGCDDFGMKNVAAPGILKIMAKILGDERSVSHQATQDLAFGGGRLAGRHTLVQYGNGDEVRGLGRCRVHRGPVWREEDEAASAKRQFARWSRTSLWNSDSEYGAEL